MSIYTKLAILRKEIKPLKKDQKGYNYKYFDVNQMIEQIQPLLEKNGLLITQPLTNINGKMALDTIVTDTETSEEIKNTAPLIELSDPQKMGGCITYFRRYALQSLLFLEAEDDDAQEASGKVAVKPQTQATKAKGYEPRKYSYSPMPTMSDGAPFPS